MDDFLCDAKRFEETTKAKVEKIFGYETKDECVSSHNGIKALPSSGALLLIIVPVIPVYIAVMLLRYKIAKKLQKQRWMSTNTRRIHEQLLKAITYQAFIPMFSVVGVLMYILQYLDVVHHPILEFLPYALFDFVPVLNPLTSFIFIRSYRLWLVKIIHKINDFF
ncbi:hypothetical protein OESDEN_08980 [Oesophagostomum dentatum]|uniref:G-protein coupled receptors family 1 profile domain-containing protein n=1 Tax=Oesophagostomum dentatum TaxID=61180 RepID=A0A0B1T4Y2_OESDE|nr:hypothetical protein OESDEN_08980 [Oesophagostomum dentatum]